jgi:hypothetical protein
MREQRGSLKPDNVLLSIKSSSELAPQLGQCNSLSYAYESSVASIGRTRVLEICVMAQAVDLLLR